MKYKTLNLLIIFLTLITQQQFCFGQDSTRTNKWFIGYETLEMSMNRFQNFAGEIGYRINPKNQLRLVIGEVKLTEAHLSNTWQAVAVDGANVDGYFRIYELNYDRFFGKRKNWYYGGNIGYTNDKYNHLIANYEKINNHTAAIGFHFGFQKMNLFNVKHLYINFALPFRYYFNSIPEQQWGDTKILEHKFVNNIWFFVGYNI